MSATKFVKIVIVALAIALIGGAAIADSVRFVTCVGGASGMTLTLNPYTGSVVRGCAPKMMDYVIADYCSIDPDTVKHAYTRVNFTSEIGTPWGEPTTTPPALGEVKFTGNGSDAEIAYATDAATGTVVFAVSIQKDSVCGLRLSVNRQDVSALVKPSGAPGWTYTSGKVSTDGDADMAQILSYIGVAGNGTLSNPIPVEGGLTECYMDSGWRGIDEWNHTAQPNGSAAPTVQQPQLYAPNFSTTVDNLLSVVVLAAIYNKCGMPTAPLNLTTQMERLITGGFVDNWDAFFNIEGIHIPLTNVYREPLSGTCITYKGLIMRGVKQSPNGTILTAGPASQTDVNNQSCVFQTAVQTSTDANYGGLGYNWHRSGIPGMTCVPKTTDDHPLANPGGGRINDFVDWNQGAHGYTFLQKFQDATGTLANLKNIRVAMINGYSPYDFSSGNSLPGINGVPDVDNNLLQTYYKNVVEGKYPLWTYNHCFARPGTYQVPGTTKTVVSQGLADFLAKFKSLPGVQAVRSVGLIPLGDMINQMSIGRTPITDTNSPNYGRGPAWARCGFYSPITGELVRDGMMMIQNDPNGPENMPGEPYVEMRP